jgi:hypothetical protein
MVCAPGPVFYGTEGIGSSFHVLHFRRYRGRWVQFSYFTLSDQFSAVPRALGLVIMFCAPGPYLGGTKGVRSSFHVLRSHTRFQRYRARRVHLSSFVLPDPFSAVPRKSGPVFMFCTPRAVFDSTEDVKSSLHVLCTHTRFRRY